MSLESQIASTIGEATVQKVFDILKSNKPSNLVSGVMAPPGSGKSTFLVAGIQQNLKKFFKQQNIGNTARIFVVEPTIPATQGLYRHMKKIYPKIKIGFSAESRIFYNLSSEIVYCTGGHLENKMLSYF